MFLRNSNVHETFANEYVKNSSSTDRGTYLGKQRIFLDSDGNVAPLYSNALWVKKSTSAGSLGANLEDDAIVNEIKEFSSGTQARINRTVPLGDSDDFVMVDGQRWTCANPLATSDKLQTQMKRREIKKAYGTLSRNDETSGHVVFFTVDGDQVTIYDPNGRSAVFFPEIRTRVSMTFDLTKHSKGEKLSAELKAIGAANQELDKSLLDAQDKLTRLRSKPLETTKVKPPQTPPPPPTEGKRKLHSAFTLSDDLEVIALNPEEARSLAVEHKAVKKRNADIERQRGAVLSIQKQQLNLVADRTIELDNLKQGICDSIRSNVSKHFADMAYVSYGIVDGESAMSVEYNPDATFTVTFTVRCIPSDDSVDLYEGYSDSWVDAHIHSIDNVLLKTFDGVTSVTTDTRVRQRDAQHSKTVAATEYFCEDFSTVFATVPNMNFSIGTKRERKISKFLRDWMGGEMITDVNGICATLVMLFLKNYVDTGDVKTAEILNSTKTMFFRKEDGEILLLLYLLGQMSGPMIAMKEKLLPALQNKFDEKMIKAFNELNPGDTVTVTIVRSDEITKDQSRHPYKLTGGDIPDTTIYALGNLGDTGNVERIRQSLGFIQRSADEPIKMSIF